MWIDKCVSTNRDECNDVGSEISADSKQEAVFNKAEYIVSTNGDIGLICVERFLALTLGLQTIQKET